jgi:hypothetical protein
MATTTKKAAVITIELDTGHIVSVEGINGAEAREMPLQDMATVYNQTGAGYNCVGWIVHSHSSDPCLRVIGGSLVRVC